MARKTKAEIRETERLVAERAQEHADREAADAEFMAQDTTKLEVARVEEMLTKTGVNVVNTILTGYKARCQDYPLRINVNINMAEFEFRFEDRSAYTTAHCRMCIASSYTGVSLSKFHVGSSTTSDTDTASIRAHASMLSDMADIVDRVQSILAPLEILYTATMHNEYQHMIAKSGVMEGGVDSRVLAEAARAASHNINQYMHLHKLRG